MSDLLENLKLEEWKLLSEYSRIEDKIVKLTKRKYEIEDELKYVNEKINEIECQDWQ